MKIEFNVHGVATTVANTDVVIDGDKIAATIPCYEVELTTSDPRHGSLVLRFVGSQVEIAKRAFPNDGVVVWDVQEKPPALARPAA